MNVIIHYDEIGLKKGNRSYFEHLLMQNIKEQCLTVKDIKKEYGYIIIDIQKKDVKALTRDLQRIPGISYFAISSKSALSLDSFSKKAIALVKDMKFKSFKISTKRHNKNFKHNSYEINCCVGEAIRKERTAKVVMNDPDLTITIEICDNHAYLWTLRVSGIGGMPTDSKNKMICLLSGGIDSPIAAYQMMRRGIKNIFVHFQNETAMKGSVENKIQDIVKVLSLYQGNSKLYIIPFGEIQKQIIANVDSKFRMLIYRRMMLRIAEKISYKENAKALIVGDSLSQVASQTPENLEAVYAAVRKPIFAPLISFHKDEIVKIARSIGSYEISIQPYTDCCSYYIAKHPATKASIEVLSNNEENLDVTKLVQLGVKSKKILRI